jgi:hypothetical protein
MTSPGGTGQVSLVLSPEQLAEYARVNSDLPALVVKARNDELRRQFTYATLSLLSGILALLSIIGGYIYLVVQGHPRSAAGLLATGVLGLIGGFIRSRL